MTLDADQKDVLSMTMREFIEATAAKTPMPGGGSVAGVVGALAVALGEMSLAFTQGKTKFADHEELYAHLAKRFSRARQMFADLITDDMQAFGLYQQATEMEDGPAKEEQTQLALAAAIDVPREAAKLALALLGDLASLADKCSVWLVSDLAAAAALAVAVVRLSDYNVRINAKALADRRAAEDILTASATDVTRAEDLLDQIEHTAKL